MAGYTGTTHQPPITGHTDQIRPPAARQHRHRRFVLGLVPVTAPERAPSMEEVAAAAVAVTDRLGVPRSALRDRLGVSPACGLANATGQWARTAVGLARDVAEAFARDPEAI